MLCSGSDFDSSSKSVNSCQAAPSGAPLGSRKKSILKKQLSLLMREKMSSLSCQAQRKDNQKKAQSDGGREEFKGGRKNTRTQLSFSIICIHFKINDNFLVPPQSLSYSNISTIRLSIFTPYLIFVTGTTGGACVKIFCQV